MTTLSDTAAKRQLSQLQKAIIDGLEDIKAQNIAAFDTTHLSPLFERVIVASATSSRQTKALAASVRDKLREAGFDKPRTEGEENGEWIIVDCGPAVVHIMQPGIRDYYRIEEIWGEKPVKASAATKKAASRTADAAAPKPKQPKKAAPAKAADTETEAPTAKAARTKPKTAVKKTAVKSPPRATTKTAAKNTTKAAAKTAAKTGNKPAARKTAVKKSTAKPAAAKTSARTATRKPKATAKTATQGAARKTRTTPSAD
ncbi:ribosome silencing factor [Corticibacter populi]|uniref:Ribosomal silencing factor RsfS n=1 Tax=Corticibacter populi TaxID=1550736 RepID=A0A3M6QPK7_9BURK|nr:ribosome silencing factor [Corticibacter populi]RMX04993.1 ribosome silencing factor [Corticibacter populi]RZS33576.1 ribosome-associated protein [Corticibacter populi]